MIALGHKRAGHQLVKSLERVTNGAVSRYQLRPDIFGAPPTGHLPEVSDAA
nr:YdaS family helix-turn-helix protein [Xylella fastidiosa]